MKAAYVRVYYEIIDDPKFVGIYDNDHHLATWMRLLIAADAVWPASATLPVGTRKASIVALSEAGLIVVTGTRFRVHGLDSEREKRKRLAQHSADRSHTGRVPDGERTDTERVLDVSAATRGRASARLGSSEGDTPSEDRAPEDPVLTFLASVGATIPPTGNGFHVRLVKLVDRHGADQVLAAMHLLRDTGQARTDRQFLFGAENALDAIPLSRNGSKPKGYSPAIEEAERAFR